jgi:hypothetical protein
VSGETELAGELETVEGVAGKLSGRDEDAERDRQVEAARVLGQVGGREVDRDMPRREFEARVLDRGANAVARFLHFGFGKADDREARQPVGEMHFDGHRRRRHPRQRAAVKHGERHALLPKTPMPI